MWTLREEIYNIPQKASLPRVTSTYMTTCTKCETLKLLQVYNCSNWRLCAAQSLHGLYSVKLCRHHLNSLVNVSIRFALWLAAVGSTVVPNAPHSKRFFRITWATETTKRGFARWQLAPCLVHACLSVCPRVWSIDCMGSKDCHEARKRSAIDRMVNFGQDLDD